jgi:serine/threonine-protein kinase
MYVRVMGQAGRGETLSIQPAVDAFNRVLEVDPRFTWALSELGQTYLTQAQFERLHGIDPRSALKRARTQFERVHDVDATFSATAFLAVRTLCIQLGYETDHGIDAAATIDALTKAVATCDALKLGGWYPIFWKARSLRLRAADELSRGEDPRSRINEGIAEIRSFVKVGEESAFMLRELVELRLVEADYALRNKDVPNVDLAKECERMQKEVKGLTAAAIDEPVLLGRIEWLMLKARSNDSDIRENDFDRVFAEVESMLAVERDDPRGYEVLSELRAEKAWWLESQHESPDAEIKKALGWVTKVLAIDAHHANMLVLQGQLYAMTARMAHGEERTGAITKAKEAFVMAFRENPRLELRYAVEVRRLSAL